MSSSQHPRRQSSPRLPSLKGQSQQRSMANPQREADSSQLLPFQRQIVASLIPPPDAHHSAGNLLVILARGLGMRYIIATLVRYFLL